MFKDFKLIAGRPVYIQIKDYMKHLIIKGGLQGNQKLPSTRELSTLLKVSRNSVISAYAELEDDGFAYAVQGQEVMWHLHLPAVKQSLPGRWTGRRVSMIMRGWRRIWIS